MITLLTGIPGAGKTAWLVQEHLMPLMKMDFKEDAFDEHGNPITVTRRIFTNVNGLMIPHELIGPDELNTWPEWVKPGDLIIYDEIQKPWPKVPAGSKKPSYISELETHRHYGIDMWLLTQNTNLVNDAAVTLCGQHKHIRKIGDTRFATVYEWDQASKTLNYKAALTMKGWRRKKATERLYKSSALHTRQKRALPTLLWVFLAVMVSIPFAFKYVTGRMDNRFDPVQAAASAASASPASKVPGLLSSTPRPYVSSPTASITALPEAAKPKLLGCVATRTKCECYDTQGAWVDTEIQQCRQSAGRGGVLVPYELHSPYVASMKSLPAPHDPDEMAPVMAAFTDHQLKR